MKHLNSIYILIGAALLTVTACVKEKAPAFQDSASARLEKAIEAQKNILSGHRWRMEYYPHSSQAYGGYNLFVEFTDTEVTAWGEVAESLDKSYTSLYKFTNDNGPVLSFDMFNYVLHYFSTPSGSSMANIYGQTGLYQAYEGDFEFLVLEASASEVLLKGKRSGCLIHMYPFEGDPVEYLQKVEAAKTDNFVATVQGADFTISAFNVNLEGTDYLVEMDRDMQQMYFTKSGEEESTAVAFMYTPDGIKFYEPFASVSEIVWDTDTQSAKAGSAVMENRMPEGWIAYDKYIGTYELTYNDNDDWLVEPKTATVTLEADVEGASYILKGVSDKYTLKVKYDLAGGNLVLMGQIMGKFGDNDVYFAAMYASRAASGSATWTGWRSANYGIKTKADPETLESDPDHFTLNFVPGPSAAGKGINSFGLLMQKPDGSSGGWMRPANEDDHSYDDWFIFGDNYYALFWKNMVKK